MMSTSIRAAIGEKLVGRQMMGDSQTEGISDLYICVFDLHSLYEYDWGSISHHLCVVLHLFMLL